MNEFDEFSEVEAQADPDFLREGGDYSATGLTELEQFEAALAEATVDEEQFQGLDYESFIILKKQDLLKFLRAVEPWVKVSVDQYGKCVRIRSTSVDEVELSYVNASVRVVVKIVNKSGKTIPTYYLQVSTFKRLVTETYASLVLVHENNELNIAILDNLLFVETMTLNDAEYQDIQIPDQLSKVDVESLALVTKKLSFVLAATDRVAEKVVNFKADKAYISTAVFAAKVKNPFSIDGFSLSKVCLDLLGILTEVSKITFNIAIVTNQMVIQVDGLWTVVIPIFKLDETLIQRAEDVTNFDANMNVANESLVKLVDVVRSFEYLSEVLEFKVGEQLEVIVRSKDLTRKTTYQFPYTGTVEQSNDIIRISAAVVKPYLHLGGDNTYYAFTKYGWGLNTEWGSLLIRKTI